MEDKQVESADIVVTQMEIWCGKLVQSSCSRRCVLWTWEQGGLVMRVQPSKWWIVVMFCLMLVFVQAIACLMASEAMICLVAVGRGWGGHVKSGGSKVALVWAWVHEEVVEMCPSEGLCAPRGYGADSGCPL